MDGAVLVIEVNRNHINNESRLLSFIHVAQAMCLNFRRCATCSWDCCCCAWGDINNAEYLGTAGSAWVYDSWSIGQYFYWSDWGDINNADLERPEVLGSMIAGALVGTFTGVLLSYCYATYARLRIKTTINSFKRNTHYHVMYNILVKASLIS